MQKVDPEFANVLSRSGDFDGLLCMNCGTCTALCPHELDIRPRELFRYAALGLKDRMQDHADAVFSCLLCKMCEANCPRGVHITENIRTVRHYHNHTVFKV
jgi:heterodisulfide reductase subunit C